jgi:hypothetical protein
VRDRGNLVGPRGLDLIRCRGGLSCPMMLARRVEEALEGYSKGAVRLPRLAGAATHFEERRARD